MSRGTYPERETMGKPDWHAFIRLVAEDAERSRAEARAGVDGRTFCVSEVEEVARPERPKAASGARPMVVSGADQPSRAS